MSPTEVTPVDIPEVSVGDQLVLAAGIGDHAVVEDLLKAGVDPNARCPPPVGKLNCGTVEVVKNEGENIDVFDGHWSRSMTPHQVARTALQAAAGGGHLKVVILLLGAGAHVNAPPAEWFGRTALQAAAEGGHQEVVKMLIASNAGVNVPAAERHGRTALQAAAEGGHAEVVTLLIDSKADVNASPAEVDGKTAVQAAAGGGHHEVVKMLIDSKADVNATSAGMRGRTALQAAAGGGYEEVVKLLVDSKADVDAPPAKYDGRTALQAAAGGGHKEVVKILIASNADVNAPPAKYRGRAALQAAAQGGYQEVVKLLLESMADINAPPAERRGRTALQAAAEGGHQEVVKLLIDSNADVNAPPAKHNGWTALQAAAEGGYEELVKLLIDSKADVNTPPAEHGGRTALQAAAEGGHFEVVKVLVDSNADVNAPPAAHDGGRTALQAAAEGGHKEVVKLLIDSRADVNAPPAKYEGRTALQAAAGDGNVEVVKLLIKSKAYVNAPPAQHDGRTALQAAAEGGHGGVVKLLIDFNAGVNAPPAAYSGQTALQAAVHGCHKQVLKLLADAQANFNEGNSVGQTILHQLCNTDNTNSLRLLLKVGLPDVDTKDHSGSTPLHIAVRQKNKPAIKLLIKNGARMDIKDHLSQTAIEAALEVDVEGILEALLEEGASTNGLLFEKWFNLGQARREFSASNIEEMACTLYGSGAEPKSIKVVGVRDTAISDLQKTEWTSPSLFLLRPKVGGTHAGYNKSFTNPSVYLHKYYTTAGPTTGWGWITLDVPSTELWDRNGPVFLSRVPNNHEILSLKPAREAVLVGYVSFCSLVHDTAEEPTIQDTSSYAPMKRFKLKSQDVEISWIMRESTGASGTSRGSFLRSVHFRGTLNLKYFTIPSHGVEFFTLFLDDIYATWLKVFEDARAHLVNRREAQLKNAGNDGETIRWLLNDSQQWSKLWMRLQEHLSKSNEILGDFKRHDVLYTELVELDERIGGIGGGINPEELGAIKKLSVKIRVLREDCSSAISGLQKETKEMIELESNLVSIFEARRTIEISEIAMKMAEASNRMAKDSNSMSVSIKRLSLVTITFLPLSFAAGLLGANVDVLEKNPNLVWYIAVAVPTLTLVMVWILLKYIDISDRIERGIEPRLEPMLKVSNQSGTVELTGNAPHSLGTTGLDLAGPTNSQQWGLRNRDRDEEKSVAQ